MALKLTGAMQNYAWGDTRSIAELQGRAPSGEPEAELWFGSHPSAPSLSDDGPLDQVIARDPRAHLGSEAGEELPFLVKLLAAATPLSLQAHPSLEQARAGFQREEDQGIPVDADERNYKDANHKPELLVALTQFRAMAGFRPAGATAQLLRELQVAQLRPLEERLVAAGQPESHRLQQALEWVMSLEGEQLAGVVGVVVKRCDELLNAPGPLGEVARNVAFLAGEYPGDVGILAALLLNHVTLEPGEALFLGAGNLHAYLTGLGVEVMANSNNVLRGGLTEKHIDVAELLDVLEFEPLEDPTASVEAGQYHVPVADFSAARHQLGGGERVRVDGPAIVLNVAGEAQVGEVVLGPGEAAWVAAFEGAVEVRAEAEADVFVVSR